MARQLTSLAKDTAIYGVSSILGKFLNWLLVPLYTHVLATPADYGQVTNLYAWTALLLVILTYGMETGFFRFINKEDEPNPPRVYSTSMISVGSTSLLFAILVLVFSPAIANRLGYAPHPEYIWLLGFSVAMDAFASIPFAYLRYKKMPIRFAAIKMLNVALNIVLNLWFFIACPFLMRVAPATVSWFYNPSYGVGYIFIANFISTFIQTAFLLPYIVSVKWQFNKILLINILKYSLPLLVLGIAGIMNQILDKILFPFLLKGHYGDTQLGIYGATSKMALVILMFTQAFRYAYEPFVFAQKREKSSLDSYSSAMTYFVIFSWLIFLGMVFYIDIFKILIAREYWIGLQIVPVVLLSFIFQGVYFNLSIWYKLTDRTMWGAWFALIGTVIIVAGNILLVPRFSYWGSVWSAFTCYFIIMLLSYLVGLKYLNIPYNLRTLGLYSALALLLYALSAIIVIPYNWVNLIFRTFLFAIFIFVTIKHDFPLNKIPYINKYFR